MSEQAKSSFFRQKSLKRISSPEQLTDYLHVTNPGIWIFLAAVVVLLAGIFVWSTVGTLETTAKAAANLFRGTCGAYTPIEMYLLDELDSLDENHPILKRFRERGLIVNVDELEALSTNGRIACSAS